MTKPGLTAAFLIIAAVAARAQDEFSKTHVQLYKKVAPAVVFVKGGSQMGSGVIIDRSGIVLTTPTACGSSDKITVRTRGHLEHSARVLGRVPERDLVVLKIEGNGPFAAIEVGDSEAVKIGQVVYAFGDSFGSIVTDDQVHMSLGVLSARYDIADEKLKGSLYRGPVLEVSAAVNQNQDGGPVVDRSGRLIGLTSLNYDESKFTGIAIPVNVLKKDIERIVKGTTVTVEDHTPKGEAWLGVDLDETDDGLVVLRVYGNTPAEKAGLKRGDIIRKVNGKKLLTNKTYVETVGSMKPGDAFVIRVVRDGKELDVNAVLGKKPVY